MEREWQLLNEALEFKVQGKWLVCRVSAQVRLKFFALAGLRLECEGVAFDRSAGEQGLEFLLALPQFKEELVWRPEIKVGYELKRFGEEEIMRSIEALRKDFCSKI